MLDLAGLAVCFCLLLQALSVAMQLFREERFAVGLIVYLRDNSGLGGWGYSPPHFGDC